ncbi:MAG: radical SAM protein [Deltaproteobacteria bacterium]|nr:MAG: radical SAM protein [Deltaproteobacteria bacterium]
MSTTSALCNMAPLTPSHGAALSAPDLLRLESFGSLYYERSRCSFHALPPHLTRLLVGSCQESALEVYARKPDSFGMSETKLVETVVRWQKAGWLDESFRCKARILNKKGPRGVISGPLVTHLQLTHGCNLRCSHCYVSIVPKPPPDELSTEMLLAMFADLQAMGSPVVVLAGGEPLLRRDIWTLVDALKSYELDAWLCTNATLIKEEQADKLAQSALRGVSVSLDGPDAETHDAIRGPKRFEHACRGIRALVQAGVRDVTVRVTVSTQNLHNLSDFAPLADELGVAKVVFKAFRQTGEASNEGRLLVPRDVYLRTIERVREEWPSGSCPAEFGDGIPNRPPDWTQIIPTFGCAGGTVSVTVNAKGRVVGCGPVETSNDWFLQKHSFQECWHHAPTIQRWRELDGNSSCFSCANLSRCGGGCRARALAVGRGMNGTDPWSFCSTPSQSALQG